MNMKRTVKIGIMSQDKIRQRAIAIAKGKYKPEPGEPKVWFTSIRSVAEVLSEPNRALLRAIAEAEPRSLQELADVTGRAPSNLSRTLKTLEHYGFVTIRRDGQQIRPVANATEFVIRAA